TLSSGRRPARNHGGAPSGQRIVWSPVTGLLSGLVLRDRVPAGRVAAELGSGVSGRWSLYGRLADGRLFATAGVGGHYLPREAGQGGCLLGRAVVKAIGEPPAPARSYPILWVPPVTIRTRLRSAIRRYGRVRWLAPATALGVGSRRGSRCGSS